MKNKKIVILLILSILLVVTSLIPMPVEARPMTEEELNGESSSSSSDLSLGNIMDGADNFIVQGQGQQNDTINQDQLHSTINFLYQLFAGVGLVVATVVGIIIGIKLMMAASSDEKAHYQHQLIAYVIGVVVIVGGIGIWQLVVTIMNNADPTEAEYTKPEPGTITDAGVYDMTEQSSSSPSTSSSTSQSATGSTGTTGTTGSTGTTTNSGNNGSSSNNGGTTKRPNTLTQHDPDNYYRSNSGGSNKSSSSTGLDFTDEYNKQKAK